MGQPFRIEPSLPPAAYKTYAIHSPQRDATCAEADCPAHRNGWVTLVPSGGPAADYIRTLSGRRFTEEQKDGGLTRFTFEAGQQCFEQHRLPAEGRERFRERDGDWRGNPTGRVIEHSAAGWTDSFGEHQERLAQTLERG